MSSIPAEVVDDVIWRPTNIGKYARYALDAFDYDQATEQYGDLRVWQFVENPDPREECVGYFVREPWSNRMRDGLLHPLVLAERDRVAGLGDRATRVEQQWLEKYFGWWLETGEDCPE